MRKSGRKRRSSRDLCGALHQRRRRGRHRPPGLPDARLPVRRTLIARHGSRTRRRRGSLQPAVVLTQRLRRQTRRNRGLLRARLGLADRIWTLFNRLPHIRRWRRGRWPLVSVGRRARRRGRPGTGRGSNLWRLRRWRRAARLIARRAAVRRIGFWRRCGPAWLCSRFRLANSVWLTRWFALADGLWSRRRVRLADGLRTGSRGRSGRRRNVLWRVRP